ncbi:MAG TPA: hypothetical protein VJP89_13960 [Pyrinomonadaceae bacterium]|nr:hypothetical protein [Pyrinomonadaceae bacterium]
MKRQSSHHERSVVRNSALIAVTLIILCACSSSVLAQWTQPDASGNINNTNTANVGIGTTTPGFRLDVQNGLINSAGGLCIAGECKTAWSQIGGSQWTTSGLSIFYPSGNVGIGTSGAPTRKLEVLGGNIFHRWSTTPGMEFGFYTAPHTNHFTSNLYFDGGWKMIGTGKGSLISLGPQFGEAFAIWADNTSRTANAASTITQLVSVTLGGQMGLGTGAPGYKFDVQGGQINSSGGLCIAGDCKTAWSQVSSQWTTSGTTINYSTGNVGIGVASPAFKLDVQGGSINSSGGLCIAGDCKTAWSQVGGLQWTTNGNDINNTNSGNLGVGTTAPAAKLHVNGGIYSASVIESANTNGFRLVVTGPGDWRSSWTYDGGATTTRLTSATNVKTSFGSNGINDRMFLDLSGNVGINTTLPGSKLHVVGAMQAPAVSGTGTNGMFRLGALPTTNLVLDMGVDATTNVYTWLQSRNQTNYATNYSLALNPNGGSVGVGTVNPGYKLDVQGGSINSSGGLCIAGDCKSAWNQVGSQWTTSGSTINYSSGNVGIGVASPTSKLHVAGTVEATGLSVNGTPVVSSQWSTSGTTVNYATGNVGIATANPTEKLHVTGNVKVSGNIDIGGNINAKYQDMAEWVDSPQALTPATVVVLDSTKSNQVIASTRSYDSRVAGVISLKPGVALGEAGEGRVLVATTGRVKVRVDAANGPINIGDLLVTSNKEGVAMKSMPVEIGGVSIHRPGTLIGKALEPLAQGTGEILVLLSLQ